MPRMKMLPWPGPLLLNVTLGRIFKASSMVVMFSAERSLPVRAWMVAGTFWIFSVRRFAVTTTSSTLEEGELVVAATASAMPTAEATASAPAGAVLIGPRHVGGRGAHSPTAEHSRGGARQHVSGLHLISPPRVTKNKRHDE